MTAYQFKKTNAGDLQSLKREYLQDITAPLDGMWETFADMADHYTVHIDEKTAGYFVVNSEKKLMQFHLPAAPNAPEIFQRIITEFKITGAFASTVEPAYLSLCLDHQSRTTVNALMYYTDETSHLPDAKFPEGSEFRLVAKGELEIAVAFAVEAIGANEEWLTGYYSEHIAQEQLYGLWQGNEMVAAGELRKSTSQKPIADVGMVVSPQQRGNGIATNILLQLRRLARENGLAPICSTERENIAAQKAITKAGFIAYHRVLDITF
ncbi:GNAT family N-acetyltransferase [Kordiimonas aquimaris]|uniref:GNAT family N-acetyltransferase n=1 Tax=Kordiimonas aquimaris TaxID=707591 RepID=UPI0021D006C9|nr:GNAT family N-acetyltransferase [Kordiimonas aquimaris]